MERKLEAANKSAASIQITAEQLIREASSLSKFDEPVINDLGASSLQNEADIQEYKGKKRKEYEDILRRRRIAPRIWIAYGRWEAECLEFDRSRSVFERGLTIDYESVELWNSYIDMEIKYGFNNSARNLFDRVTYLLPLISHFWLRYILFEESLQNYDKCRQIFEKWLLVSPTSLTIYTTYMKFELRNDNKDKTDEILHRALLSLGSSDPPPALIKFIRKNRLKVHYDRLPYPQIIQKAFDRKDSSRLDTDILIPDHVAATNYDERFDLIRRIQHHHFINLSDAVDTNITPAEVNPSDLTPPHIIDSLRKLYSENLVKGQPKNYEDKSIWKKWFYLCLHFALFEEVIMQDPNRARQVYETLADLFTKHPAINFSKLWRLWANFEIRQKDIHKARLVYGRAIGQLKQDQKIYDMYIDMELRLQQIDRCRKIAAIYIQNFPQKAKSWLTLIDIELLVNEHARARKIFEIGIQHDLDDPELLWKSYTDVETNLGNIDHARKLFNRLYDLTQSWKVLSALTVFEWKTNRDLEKARHACQRAIQVCKEKGLDVERASMIHLWLKLEQDLGTPDSVEEARNQMPTKVKKRRTLISEDGSKCTEEYTAYIFQEDESKPTSSFALLQAAQEWRKKKESSPGSAVT